MKNTYNLINFGFNPWSDYWKRNQTITYLLGKMDVFDRVLFVNSEVWLGSILRSCREQLSSPNIYKWKALMHKNARENINVFTPSYLPYKSKIKFVSMINDNIIYNVFEQYTNKPVVLIVNTPSVSTMKLAEYFLQRNTILRIFDWSDDFVEFSSDKEERSITDKACKFYCRNFDIVLTVNDFLAEKSLKYNPNTYTIKNATNFFTFYNCYSEKIIPNMIKKLKRQMIGYIGWLNSLRLDEELIYFIAKSKPEWQFVFMGPKSDPLPLGNRIPRLENMHILSPVPYSMLPSYLTAFDVCILPNKVNCHTRGNDPIKIYDYLASGNPIVSTRTAGVEQFKQDIRICDSSMEFLQCLELALKENTTELRVRRQEIARRHSWQTRIEEVYNIIKPRLRVEN